MAWAMRRAKNAVSMRSDSSKLQARTRIIDAGLYAPQARNSPLRDSTRTVSPLSALPLAMLPSKIHGWRRNSERSLASRSLMSFMRGFSTPVRPELVEGLADTPPPVRPEPVEGLVPVRRLRQAQPERGCWGMWRALRQAQGERLGVLFFFALGCAASYTFDKCPKSSFV